MNRRSRKTAPHGWSFSLRHAAFAKQVQHGAFIFTQRADIARQPVRDVIDRLSKLIDQSVFFYYSSEDEQTMLTQGEFRIMRFGWLANSGRPVIKGKIVAANGGTTVELRMTLKSLFLKSFAWLMYAMHFAIFATAIITVVLGYPINLPFGLFLLGFQVLHIGFPLLLFHSEARLAESALRKALV